MADAAEGRRVCGMPEKAQLHVAMLALQFGYAGFHVVSRLALNMGISKLVFPVYRNIIALCLLVPFAYFLEKKDRPRLTLSFAVQFFLLALCGITANQGFYLLGLDNTSPTFASAIQNSVPAITFAMAAALRIEKVRLDRRDGVAKVAGTLACVAGASVITLYKGPTIFGGPDAASSSTSLSSLAGLEAGEMKNWTLGVRVPDRALPVVVGLAGAAGPRAEEVPGEAVGHLLHLLLRRHPVPHNRRLHGEGRRRMEVPLRIRALHNPIRSQYLACL